MFQDFRELALREYELAPENFYSLPGLSLSAALKLTGVELELISDPNLYLWFESMIRGGICFVANRESRSNLEHMANYDPSKNCVATYYLDANNLCKSSIFVLPSIEGLQFFYHSLISFTDGHSMSQYLPYANLRFCKDRELQELRREFRVYKGQNLEETSNVGFALEVTLRYPEDKMEFFCQYPPLR